MLFMTLSQFRKLTHPTTRSQSAKFKQRCSDSQWNDYVTFRHHHFTNLLPSVESQKNSSKVLRSISLLLPTLQTVASVHSDETPDLKISVVPHILKKKAYLWPCSYLCSFTSYHFPKSPEPPDMSNYLLFCKCATISHHHTLACFSSA